ncbi:MAG: DUF4249 domain-containing protein [Cytophagaceae bacterium]|nr:DUF4249 domain-containing protein [Cytophagaceae bacterium]
MLSLPFLRKSMVVVGALLLGLSACVDPYEPKLTLTAEVLVVDGVLTDIAEKQTVKIGRSRVFNRNFASTVAVRGAQVEVLVNGTPGIKLNESIVTPGTYELPEGFRGQAGSRYQLRFQLPDGKHYESSVETMPTGPKIGKVYDAFDSQGIANAERTRFTPANLIYIDTQDPADERNFYQWRWTLWEQQVYCASCQRGIFISTNDLTGDGNCRTDNTLPVNNFFDYDCISPCWDIIRGVELNLFADVYGNGRPLTGRLVAKIPLYHRQPALVEIRQYALTPGAYRYFKLFEDQTQNTGGLADTPPSPIVGNVRSLDVSSENVVGYFSASSVSGVRYWLDRRNTSGTGIGLLLTLFGHAPNPEPATPFPLRPPPARCVPSDTRTPIKPEGWR